MLFNAVCREKIEQKFRIRRLFQISVARRVRKSGSGEQWKEERELATQLHFCEVSSIYSVNFDLHLKKLEKREDQRRRVFAKSRQIVMRISTLTIKYRKIYVKNGFQQAMS